MHVSTQLLHFVGLGIEELALFYAGMSRVRPLLMVTPRCSDEGEQAPRLPYQPPATRTAPEPALVGV